MEPQRWEDHSKAGRAWKKTLAPILSSPVGVMAKLRASKEQVFSSWSKRVCSRQRQSLGAENKLVSGALAYDGAGNKSGEVGRTLKCQAELGP